MVNYMKWILEHVNAFYGHLRIRTKIMLNFIIVTLMITVSVSWFYYNKAAAMLEDEITKTIQGTLEQADINIQNVISTIEESSLRLYSNAQLREVFRRDSHNYPNRQQFDDYKMLNDICNTYNTNKNIHNIRLFFSHSGFYTRDKINFYTVEDANQMAWYNEAQARNGSLLWISNFPEQYTITCVRALIDYSVTDYELGYIALDIKESIITDILDRIGHTIQANIYLVNGKGVVVSAGDKSLIGKELIYNEQLELLQDDSKNFRYIHTDNKRQLLMITRQNPEWQLVALVSLDGVKRRNTEILGYIVLISVAVLSVAVFMALLLSGSITGRIKELVVFLRQVDIDDKKLMTVKYNDEVSELVDNFNKMLQTTRELFNEVYAVKLSRKEAELRALQAQINPHFLYNALDSINWMANKYRAQEISRMTRLLGSFFRLSLSRGKDIVPIRDEIEHAKVYLEIMQTRFEGDIDIHFDIDEQLQDLLTVKLILQPVLENAILHGIQGRPEQTGNVFIKGFLKERRVIFRIQDDGIGMKAEVLEALQLSLKGSGNPGGYGIQNVHERIQLYFGEEYGIVVDSEYGNGTSVELTIATQKYT